MSLLLTTLKILVSALQQLLNMASARAGNRNFSREDAIEMSEKIFFQKKITEENTHIMPISEVIDKVTAICRMVGVKRLDLFGSFATGTATATSDIDFVVYGCEDMLKLEEELLKIDTLRKIDIFDYDSIHNEFLLEDIRKYGKQIY